MTPVLVLFFNIPPLTAVSSDLVASAVMKPVGSFVHLRRGTVNLELVKWLCMGSIPGAFSGVLVARAMGSGAEVQQVIRIALGRRFCSPPAGSPSGPTSAWWSTPGAATGGRTRSLRAARRSSCAGFRRWCSAPSAAWSSA